MTKSDAPLSEVATGKARKKLREPRWWAGKPIVAFDLETADGLPFVLSVSDGSTGEDYTLSERGKLLEPESVFGHLSSRRFRDTLNVWYNLGFDAEVVLSALDLDAAEEVHGTCSTTATVGHRDYDITYVPGKLLRIDTVNDGRNAVTHYDVSQFFRTSLDAAATEWLGDEAGKLGEADVERFGDPDYRRENMAAINRYAKHDSRLTRRITREFAETAERVGVPFGRPVSTGFVAAEFMRERLDSKPGWGFNPMQRLAWDAYAGGRFEVYERGSVGRVAGPDINSAYPAVMSELPDPATLSWGMVEQPSTEDVLDADYGFITAEFTTDAERRIQPFPVKRDGVVKYPALDGVTTTVTLPEFRVAVESGVLLDADIHEAALGFEATNTQRPFAFLSELYTQRKEWENAGREFAALILKIVMNSMYGKTAQTTEKRVLAEKVDPAELAPTERLRALFGHPAIETLEAGEFFNPFLASYITAETRAELHRSVVEHGLENDTVLFATDCIMVREEAYQQSDFGERLGDSLGEWDYDYQGEAFVIGSGVYEVTDADGDVLKRSTRGFREVDLGDSTLREAAASPDKDGCIPIEQDRPTTLGEALTRSNATLAEVGKFRTESRGLSPSFDSKRDWPDTSYHQLLDGSEFGKPVVLSE